MPREPALRNTCPNRQPATVGAEERGGRGTTSSRMTTKRLTRAAPELSPPKSACAGGAVLRTSTRGTVPMEQYDGCRRRGQHLTVSISTNDLHCRNPARRWQRRARSTPTLPPAPPPRPPRHVPRTHDNRMAGRQMSCRQQTAPPQSRCSKDVTAHPHRPGARPGRPCPVPACSGHPPSGQRRFSSPLQNFSICTCVYVCVHSYTCVDCKSVCVYELCLCASMIVKSYVCGRLCTSSPINV
jgi:hypothetical protein